MTVLVHVLASVGALWVVGLLAQSVLLLRARRRRKRDEAFLAALREAIDRHPAGRVATRTTCGHLIFGSDAGDLIANEIEHSRHCPHAQKGAA